MTTQDFDLPSVEDLTVQEIDLSTSRMMAGAFHLGKYCEKPMQEYSLCHSEHADPRVCLPQGKEMTACGVEFFMMVKKTCLEEFEQYAHCVDQSSKEFKLNKCRNTEAVFNSCMIDKMQLARPSWSYYVRPKVLDTERPKPKGYVSPEFPDRAKEIPKPGELPDGKYGQRPLNIF